MRITKSVGIVSYGIDVPCYRIKTKEIAEVWGRDGEKITRSLGVVEKSVPAVDEDAVTLAANASALAVANHGGSIDIGAIYTGSESHPYAVKSTSSIIGDVLSIPNSYTAADLEFACKAGTAAIQMVLGLVASGMIDYGLAIGTDTAQSRPGDALEYSAAAAAASFIVGSDSAEIIAQVRYTHSYTSDTPDFWRRERQSYPSHGGRFTGEPAYFKHVLSAVQGILKETDMKIDDFDHVVLHMPNGRFPKTAAKRLGITAQQLKLGFTVPMLGNSYSACSLVGLAAVLDNAKPGERVLLCSYGSGSGSDAFVIEITENIKGYRNLRPVSEQIRDKRYLNYTSYIRNLGKLHT